MKKLPVRLAMRREGEWWVAYAARNDVMGAAKKIGAILIEIVENNEERQDAFLTLMKAVVVELIQNEQRRNTERVLGVQQ